jgi:hypothetical protein
MSHTVCLRLVAEDGMLSLFVGADAGACVAASVVGKALNPQTEEMQGVSSR